jgi:hypothetical protein
MNSYIRKWAADADGGGYFDNQRDKLLVHDPTCQSLSDPWLPRKGGVSCPSDLFWCMECGTAFFNEGSYPDWLCECCYRDKENQE